MIELSRTYTFDLPQQRVWDVLMDTTALASCIPGCESLEPDPAHAHRYRIRLAVKLAALMGTYDGSVELVDLMPIRSYGLVAEGRGRPGFLKGKAAIVLESQADKTTLSVTGEVVTGGAIARVGQRLIQSAARMMMDRFFTRLKAVAEGRARTTGELDAIENASAESVEDPIGLAEGRRSTPDA